MFGKIQKFDLLVSIFIFCTVVSELMGAKTFPLATIGSFHLNASVAIFLIPILFGINDIITETFGKERARSVIRSSLVVIVLLSLFSLLATHLSPSTRFAPMEKAYDQIFLISIRMSIASLVAFGFAEFLDVFIFSKIRQKLGKKNLWLRTNASNFIAQFADTSIFFFIAFYALNKPFGDNFSFLFGLILPYWLLKCFMSIIETPFVYLGVGWLKRDKVAVNPSNS